MDSFINPLLIKKINSMKIPDNEKLTMKKLLNIEFEMGSEPGISDKKVKKFREELARGANE